MGRLILCLLIVSVLLLLTQPGAAPAGDVHITVTSAAFDQGGVIPSRYTCDGADISPPLAWSAVPEASRSLALICDDPDAPSGTWVHWVLYDLPAEVRELPENLPIRKSLANGAKQGLNDFRRIGYGGPCPPGGTHRYYFTLYALDEKLDLPPGVTKMQLLQAMHGHILAEGRLMGTYGR
ncbi:MAG: YbhB/YbcL family Raf kinase inhibitor-like protein [Syntrophobacteria bacterium]